MRWLTGVIEYATALDIATVFMNLVVLVLLSTTFSFCFLRWIARFCAVPVTNKKNFIFLILLRNCYGSFD